jgi:drug/metabolite transporter (DMT)-like permease
VLLSVIFFGERLDWLQTLTIGVIVVGLVITSLDFGTVRQGVIMQPGVVLALLAMLFWGIYFAFIRMPVEEIGWFLPAYIGFFFAPVVLVMMRVQRVTLQSPLSKGALGAFVAMVVLGTAANFGYNLGISSGYTSIVAPIAGSYPILFVCLSAWVFKERLQRQQFWGIAISLAGIVTLSLVS